MLSLSVSKISTMYIKYTVKQYTGHQWGNKGYKEAQSGESNPKIIPNHSEDRSS